MKRAALRARGAAGEGNSHSRRWVSARPGNASLAPELLGEQRRDRQHRLAAALDVEVAQIRVPVGPELERVAHQRDHARDPKAGERQHQHDACGPARPTAPGSPGRSTARTPRPGASWAAREPTRGSSAPWITAPARQPRQPVLALLLQQQRAPPAAAGCGSPASTSVS